MKFLAKLLKIFTFLRSLLCKHTLTSTETTFPPDTFVRILPRDLAREEYNVKDGKVLSLDGRNRYELLNGSTKVWRISAPVTTTTCKVCGKVIK